ncbi:heme exporter protein CcmD [Stenotrophomonas tumulicola]|uniref:Heme exporter protein D n=1 Tax=Stenotrophomonas tumulicola TaxID=1685415 RepID=A0A7W3FN30_9GAMM|nr:heme exporter protein CcmD [Stenotrophomonas tumulicola]MBA8682559.1 heme exporter protein CcmD [Stenotrophomonas tumulicola]
MSYLGYVVAAYAVFVLVLAIDAIGSQLRLRRALQAARQRLQRQAARKAAAAAPSLQELER